MDNVWSIMDLLFAGAGLYAIYAYYLLKTKGEITTSILMSKDVDIRKCKDTKLLWLQRFLFLVLRLCFTESWVW